MIERARRGARVANPFDAGLIYGRPLIEKHCNFWRIPRIGKSCIRAKMVTRFPPRRSPFLDSTRLYSDDPNFLQFWRCANFAGEINGRFTRCYEDRIYVFVNPPPSLSLLRPFGTIFHPAIGNIFAVARYRRFPLA